MTHEQPVTLRRNSITFAALACCLLSLVWPVHLVSGAVAQAGLEPLLAPAAVGLQSPRATVQAQPGTPLIISSPRIVSWDGQQLEVALELTNVSSKSIRAYAIKHRLEGDELSGAVVFTPLDLTNVMALEPMQSTTSFEVFQQRSAKEDQIIFLVDYVEFSDGTTWGQDSVNLADGSAGQRAGAHICSKRLLKTLNDRNPSDVVRAIETGAASIEPPANRSDNWKQGFRVGCNSVASHLKRAQKSGGLIKLEHELRKLAKRFEDAE